MTCFTGSKVPVLTQLWGVQRTAEANECSRGHKSYRGVYHSGTYGRWKARIVVKGHKIHLGTFASAEDAARAWDLKVLN